jgi:hypothetical protein
MLGEHGLLLSQVSVFAALIPTNVHLLEGLWGKWEGAWLHLGEFCDKKTQRKTEHQVLHTTPVVETAWFCLFPSIFEKVHITLLRKSLK